jgi:DNA-binding winged helix-turn-helix (wHTH) protein
MDINQPFLINRRFLIDLSRHSLHDLETQSETRLELRHINLLDQLCRNKGKLVDRNFLIKEIWDGYNGADEALTQGISVLRKMLADERKELIRIIPKKGYIFHAEINAQQQPSIVRSQPSQQKNVKVWLYGVASGMIILSVFLIFLRSEDIQEKAQHENVRGKKITYVPAAISKPVPMEKVKPGNVGAEKFIYVPAPISKPGLTEKVEPENVGIKKVNYVPAPMEIE